MKFRLGSLLALGAGLLLATAPATASVPRGRLGVQMQEMTPELREHMGAPADRGVLVVRVVGDSAAARGGVEVGDVILSAGAEAVRAPADLAALVALAPGGKELALEVIRKGERKTLQVRLDGPPGPLVHPQEWEDWMNEGMRKGRRELRAWLRELERRIGQLEKQLEEGRNAADQPT